MTMRNAPPFLFPIVFALPWLICIAPLWFGVSWDVPTEVLKFLWGIYQRLKDDIEVVLSIGTPAIASFIVFTAPKYQENKTVFVLVVFSLTISYIVYAVWDFAFINSIEKTSFLNLAKIEGRQQAAEFENSIAALRIVILTSIALLLGVQIRN